MPFHIRHIRHVPRPNFDLDIDPNIEINEDNAESVALRVFEEYAIPHPNQLIELIKETSDIFCPVMTRIAAESGQGSCTLEGFIDMLFEHFEISEECGKFLEENDWI